MPDAPRSPEVAALVAFDLYIGKTVTEAAANNNVSRETVKSWRASDWWPGLMEAVAENYLERTEALARGALIQRLQEGDAISARWLLERRSPALAPPSKRVEVSGQVDHVPAQRKALEAIPTAQLERLADEDDDAIDAFFEEANPLEANE